MINSLYTKVTLQGSDSTLPGKNNIQKVNENTGCIQGIISVLHFKSTVIKDTNKYTALNDFYGSFDSITDLQVAKHPSTIETEGSFSYI